MSRNILLSSIVALQVFGTAFAASSQTAVADMSEEELGAFIRSYLLENPEVIFDAAAAFEEKQRQAAAAAVEEALASSEEALYNDGFSYVLGNPEGAKQIVEFFDYKCGYCRKSHPEIQMLIENNPDLGIVMKEFPILGEDSLRAAKIAASVHKISGRDVYLAVHNAFMEHTGAFDNETLLDIAAENGADRAAVEDMMDGPEIQAGIAGTIQLANSLQINGTPSFIVGQEIIPGYAPLDAMQTYVDLMSQDPS